MGTQLKDDRRNCESKGNSQQIQEPTNRIIFYPWDILHLIHLFQHSLTQQLILFGNSSFNLVLSVSQLILICF